MKIPVIVVDDQEADRYLVKRHLRRADDFAELVELESGDRFLEEFYGGNLSKEFFAQPVLVLMDINMPGRNGFETAIEVQQRIGIEEGPNSFIIMMFTSSNNLDDRQKVKEIDIVKGYVEKPLDINRIDYIRELYRSFI